MIKISTFRTWMHNHFTRKQIDSVKKTLHYLAYPFIFIVFGIGVILAVIYVSIKWIINKLSFNNLKAKQNEF